MHLRDRHFFNRGNELDAPQYIYYDKMSFMRDFSIKKEKPAESLPNDVAVVDISPEPLLYEDNKDPDGSTFFDYTEQFLELIKGFPMLYDRNAAMRKYRGKEWKQIAENLSGKFTVGQLRQYWITLMKKYKLYLEHPPNHCRMIENEELFGDLCFTNEGFKLKHERKGSSQSNQYIIFDDELDENKEFLEEHNEESRMLCEVVEDSILEPSNDEEPIIEYEVQDQTGVETLESVEEIAEPEAKRIKSSTELASTSAKIQCLQAVNIHNFQPTPLLQSSLTSALPSVTSEPPQKQKSLNLPFLETLAPTMDSLPLSAQLKLRAKFMNLLAEEVAKMEHLKNEHLIES